MVNIENFYVVESGKDLKEQSSENEIEKAIEILPNGVRIEQFTEQKTAGDQLLIEFRVTSRDDDKLWEQFPSERQHELTNKLFEVVHMIPHFALKKVEYKKGSIHIIMVFQFLGVAGTIASVGFTALALSNLVKEIRETFRFFFGGSRFSF
jgi:hypothetical protein